MSGGALFLASFDVESGDDEMYSARRDDATNA
jgi:hypothetical protein